MGLRTQNSAEERTRFAPPSFFEAALLAIVLPTMPPDHLRRYCLSLPETTESLPFGPDPLVFKVAGKMFALLSLDEIPPRISLKCDPEQAVELRERFEAVTPGYHMNKKHWNSVRLRSGLTKDVVCQMIEDSYRLVVAGLKKADRERIEATLAER